LKEFGIKKVLDEDLKKEPRTKYIFQVDGGQGIYYYKMAAAVRVTIVLSREMKPVKTAA
jgi:hypothetical protein